MVEDRSLASKLIDIVIVIFLLIFALTTLLPFINIIATTFAHPDEIIKGGFLLIPRKLSAAAIKYITTSATFMGAIRNSVVITLMGTVINMFFSVTMAYALAQKRLKFRNVIMSFIVFTMVFQVGMIPNFLNVRLLHLQNTYWALTLPVAINAFNLILIKNFFQEISAELIESARMDGCNDLIVLFRIVLPLSTPILATITLFYAVGHWNSFMTAILYLSDARKWPMQVLLRNIVMLSMMDMGNTEIGGSFFLLMPESLRAAAIFVSTLPILVLYPFLQKYFVKGVMLGAVKG
ncbi:MAG: carbohydrate ABC transporter permease [Treponema sp.]|nr:carbohydrate ABC transporter permease [Treponema sp.]